MVELTYSQAVHKIQKELTILRYVNYVQLIALLITMTKVFGISSAIGLLSAGTIIVSFKIVPFMITKLV